MAKLYKRIKKILVLSSLAAILQFAYPLSSIFAQTHPVTEIEQDSEIVLLLADVNSLDPDTQESALANLNKKGEAAIPYLIAALEEKDDAIRHAAVITLWSIAQNPYWNFRKKPTEAVPALVHVLESDNQNDAIAAAFALAEIHEVPEKTLPKLIQALSDEDVAVRETTANVLRAENFENYALEVIPALLQALRDQDSSVRVSAAKSLSSFGSKAVLALLGELSTDAKYEAIYTLGQMTTPPIEAVSPLQEELKNEQNSEKVKRMAAFVLNSIQLKSGGTDHSLSPAPVVQTDCPINMVVDEYTLECVPRKWNLLSIGKLYETVQKFLSRRK
jgi:HEAT repeat protein